jgi:hypothetical protein
MTDTVLGPISLLSAALYDLYAITTYVWWNALDHWDQENIQE